MRSLHFKPPAEARTHTVGEYERPRPAFSRRCLKSLLRYCLFLFLPLLILLTGRPGSPAPRPARLQAAQTQRFTKDFFELFDTHCQIMGFAADEEAFAEQAAAIYEDLVYTHELFNRHERFPEVHNIAYLNAQAAERPVRVDPLLFELLEFSLDFYERSAGSFHPGLGGATGLWESAREREIVPEAEELASYFAHMDPAGVVLDSAERTVYFTDPEFALDLGAVAKGYAAEYAAKRAERRGADRLLLNLGGNLRTIGRRDGSDGTDKSGEDGTDAWRIGIRDPRGEGIKTAVKLLEGSIVTSGDYERFFIRDGRRYHHILDPATLFPAEGYQAVTIYHPDSAYADALSTAFFNLSPEEGVELLTSLGGEAYWILSDGSEGRTEGFVERELS